MMLDQQLIHAPVLDHRNVDLDGADRVTYLLAQSFRYDYPGPVQQLRHRLVVLPPAHHGNQHVRAHRVDVHGAVARRVTRRDVRGNTVVRIRAERVERSVQFQVGVLLERVHGDGPVRLAAEASPIRVCCALPDSPPPTRGCANLQGSWHAAKPGRSS